MPAPSAFGIISDRAKRIIFPWLPEWMLRRFFGWERHSSVEPPLPGSLSGRIRLIFGPQDEVGQATAWCRAVDAHVPGVASLSFSKGGSDSYAFVSDYMVPNDTYYWSRSWQRGFRRYVFHNATHVIAESGHRIFGNGGVGRARGEFQEFDRRGIAAAHLFHGSDIRAPRIHVQETEWSPFSNPEWELGPRYEVVSRLNRQLVDETGAPVFVSTPDLLSYVDAVWLPLVVPGMFTAAPWTRQPDRLLRVVHAPSSSFVKGSDLVEPTLWRLHEAGVIEYRRIENVPHAQMPEVYRDADVVLDGFRIGNYALVAVEAMASGCVVLGHVTDITRNRVLEQTGRVLPVLEANPHSLEAVLRSLSDGSVDAGEVAEMSVEFTTAVHDGRLSASRLAEFLGA